MHVKQHISYIFQVIAFPENSQLNNLQNFTPRYLGVLMHVIQRYWCPNDVRMTSPSSMCQSKYTHKRSYLTLCCWWLIWPKQNDAKKNMAHGYSAESTQQELSYEYQHDSVWMIFTLCLHFLHWTKITSASEGLSSIWIGNSEAINIAQIYWLTTGYL